MHRRCILNKKISRDARGVYVVSKTARTAKAIIHIRVVAVIISRPTYVGRPCRSLLATDGFRSIAVLIGT